MKTCSVGKETNETRHVKCHHQNYLSVMSVELDIEHKSDNVYVLLKSIATSQ